MELRIEKCESARPFTVFLRIPGWLNSPARITLDGQAIDPAPQERAYYPINRRWVAGDRIEAEFPMPVRFMIADPKVKDTQGKVAVMRGPVVYCLEDSDVPKGVRWDSLSLSPGAGLTPVHADELGGIVRLKGSLIQTKSGSSQADLVRLFKPEKGLYQEAPFEPAKLSPQDRSVQVGLIPYCARLNRAGKCFKIWIPVNGN